jgi:DNA-binding SARP family transcriptional activator
MSTLERQVFSGIYLRVLGRFAVLTDGGAGPELRISARKGQALLAYLAMHPEHGASREHLAALFWGDRQDERARHSLRQCLVSLRRDLLKDNADILLMDANTVGLDTTRLRVDAVEFVSLAESAEASDLERAAELYRSECLSGSASASRSTAGSTGRAANSKTWLRTCSRNALSSRTRAATGGRRLLLSSG